jgi:hypothetical protein
MRRLADMIRKVHVMSALMFCALPVNASDKLSILEYDAGGAAVDRTGVADASNALSAAVSTANAKASKGEPACVYIPAGTYRISVPPPTFVRAGCVIGDGPSQSELLIDPQLKGDILSWSEAWESTAPGPTVIGLRIQGHRSTTALQNGIVFYDRNDRVFIDNVEIDDLHGRALYSGVTKQASQAYMRESHMRSLRFFKDGAPDVPVVEFNSQGIGDTDATNEIKMSQIDIYGSFGPSFVIRSNSSGAVRFFTIEALRIEGLQNGSVPADLLTIGDANMKGNVNNIVLTGLELIDPYKGYAALRVTAPSIALAPYQITVEGMIGGGVPNGQGLRIDSGRTSTFRFSGIHTFDTNVVVGPEVSQIVLDGGGQEANWTYSIDPTSANGIEVPARHLLAPHLH